MIKSQTYYPDDPLYEQAKKILAANPTIGKNRLGALLGIKAPSSRLRIVRYRGETEGHSQHPDYVRVRELKEKNLDWGAVKIAQALALSVDHAKLHLARWTGAQAFKGGAPVAATAPSSASAAGNELDAAAPGAELHVDASADTKSLNYRGARIHTVEELLAYTETDVGIWEVDRHLINKWEVGAKDPINGGILTEPLFQIKVWLKRRVVEQHLQQLMGGLLEKFKTAAPAPPPVAYPAKTHAMLEISIMDLHLGKYAWAPETGRAYDPVIAQKMFWAALEDLLQKSSSCRPESILYVIGNDFFNVDTIAKTTTAGTPQDEAMRWQESWQLGRELMVAAIGRLRQVAPTRVLIVPGNHDTARMYYLGDLLAAWFRNTPGVEVDHTPQPRKYVFYGGNLIGYCHGNIERHEKLPMLMAIEKPFEWAASQHREWHLGHFHSKKTKVFVAHEDLASVQVRLLPSLCPADAWHASMGYTSKLAAEAYLWDPRDGCVATFTHAPN